MWGKDSVSSDAMNQHKALAGAKDKGGFGVSPFPSRGGTHPDAGMSHAPMPDGGRGMSAGTMHKGTMRQAAPDHGLSHGSRDHFKR